VTPNPGSRKALDAGCICAVLDNNHGRWSPFPSGDFWVTEGCPVHAPFSTQSNNPRSNTNDPTA
jgi:hypothetical protein